MKKHIADILIHNQPSIYLFGSITLHDFRLGWSDIDVLCLTKTPISQQQANRLLNLRQHLQENSGNEIYRSFEGGILTLETFFNKSPDTVVYWGTSGQRITDKYQFDSFCIAQLLDDGRLLYGSDMRSHLRYPSKEQLEEDIIRHYEAIRQYAVETEKSIYSIGWLFDIARGLYTLNTGKIIAKTSAGEWALKSNFSPDPGILKRAIEIRKEPEKYKNDEEILDWAGTLGESIQRFADVLEDRLQLSANS